MRPNPHSVKSSVRKKFFDNFVRNNTDNDLGIVSDGSRWDAVRGVFRVLFNKAVSETSPNQYPMATVTMPFEEVEISLKDIDSGVGAALWVTDSGNWWGVGLQQEEVPCNCSQGTQCDRWNARNCSSWNAQECYSWFCSRWSGSSSSGCASWGYFSGGNCRAWNSGFVSGPFFVPGNCSSWNSITYICNALSWNANNCLQNACGAANASNCRFFNAQTCNRWFEFTFDCETCYPQYIRVFQSISSTITTVFSAIITKTFQAVSSTYGSLNLFVQSDTSSPTAKSMKVSTENGIISAEVFSNTDLTDKIIVDEEITYSPTGAQISTKYGIIVNPSSYNQNNYIGEISIDKK